MRKFLLNKRTFKFIGNQLNKPVEKGVSKVLKKTQNNLSKTSDIVIIVSGITAITIALSGLAYSIESFEIVKFFKEITESIVLEKALEDVKLFKKLQFFHQAF